jgi:hypothetical protein
LPEVILFLHFAAGDEHVTIDQIKVTEFNAFGQPDGPFGGIQALRILQGITIIRRSDLDNLCLWRFEIQHHCIRFVAVEMGGTPYQQQDRDK